MRCSLRWSSAASSARDRGMDDAVDMWRPPDMSPKEHKRRVAACLSDDHIRFLHRARYFAKECGADTLYFDDRIRRLEPPEPKYRHAGCDGGH
jgi:hypothetical protein